MELHASGVIDHSDAEITLDMQNPGSLFAGFGGNLRLQNPAADPKVIDYCLENLRVAYGLSLIHISPDSGRHHL